MSRMFTESLERNAKPNSNDVLIIHNPIFK